jgi:hypothetical protein
VSLPGPDGTLWALGLIVFGAAVGVVGEAIRQLLASRVPLFATVDPFERVLVDLYLGGAALYLLAWSPPGLFYTATLPVAVLLAVLGLWIAGLQRAASPERSHGIPVGLHLGWRLVAIAAALLLFAIELAAAEAAPTGNTYDSGLFTAYSALLISHHTLPTSLLPIVGQPLPYPQGSTVWFASAQLLFGLPPARTPVLVTPLFLGLVPIAGFVVGRRWFSSEAGGAAVALLLTFVASWTRVMVGGSNDFVVAFPLTLLLIAWLPGWWRSTLPGWGSTLAFGLMAGCLASLNPVGAEVVLAAALFGRLAARPSLGKAWADWSARWTGAVVVTVACVAPSLWVELSLVGASGVPGTGSAVMAYGVTGSQLVGLLDPFLFRPSDVGLSPFPWLRAELAVLLVLGVVGWLYRAYWSDRAEVGAGPGLAPLALGTAAGAGILLEWAASFGNPWAVGLARLSSPSELSVLLFAVFSLVAAAPLADVFRWLESSAPEPNRIAPRSRWRWDRSPPETRAVAIVASLLVLVPGIAVTATSFPPYLAQEYRQFGNVSDSDFALLDWSTGHLPSGARVLAAPGSAAQFLPGYDGDVVLLYPVTVFGVSTNADYQLLLTELPNGTLDARGTAALDALAVSYIAVTQANNVLWLPFSPTPIAAEPRASIVFHQGDAYLFTWAAAPVAPAGL